MVWWLLPWELWGGVVAPKRQVEMPRLELELLLEVQAGMEQFVNTGRQ
jgi:hypothetical protein